MITEKQVKMGNFVNGEWCYSNSNEFIELYSPVNNEIVGSVTKSTNEDVDSAVAVARQTFNDGVWRKKTLQERGQILKQFAGLIMQNMNELIHLDGIATGHTVRKLQGDFFSVAMVLNSTVELAMDYPFSRENPNNPGMGATKNTIYREPIGVVGAIAAWNFPSMLAMWKIAPALMMGNSVVLKPATITPFATLKMAELAHQAGVPAGVLNIIVGPGKEIGEYLVTHPEVDKVSFTGSTEVGRRISELASASVKRVTLELGGKSAGIVMPDADLDIAIPGALFGCFYNSGQACESGTRLLVHEDIYDEVVERLCAETKNIVIGDPMDLSTGMGPVISEKQLNTILNYIDSAEKQGARIACGGKRITEEPFNKGFYVEPTIIVDATNDMTAAREEIFGPVLIVIKFKTEEEAIQIANDSIYGLAGGVWSRDVINAEKIARQLQAGVIWINDWHTFRFDSPFGGYKQSGNGRENGIEVFNEYTEVKTVISSLVSQRESRMNFSMLF